MHRSRLSTFVIDCKVDDLDAAAAFWSGALGRPVKRTDDDPSYRALAPVEGGPTLVLQRVEHDSRIHLDIECDDLDAEVARLEKLGATRIRLFKRWWLMQAPTGHVFCVVNRQRPLESKPDASVWLRRARRRERPYPPDRHRRIVGVTGRRQMKQHHRMIYAALAIACLALALSIRTALREPRGASAAAPGACTDQQARDQIAILRNALAGRDALIGQLGRAANPASDPPSAVEPSQPPRTAETPAVPATPAASEAPAARRPRYTRFETPNPAVSVTQKADGTYEIRTTDPALAGSVMEVTAVTASGDETKVMIRIPD
jgi:hypothetical protein